LPPLCGGFAFCEEDYLLALSADAGEFGATTNAMTSNLPFDEEVDGVESATVLVTGLRSSACAG